MNQLLLKIAGNFDIQSEIQSIDPLGEGFINDTFIVKCLGEKHKYLFQRKNKDIFKNIPGMMENIQKLTAFLKRKIVRYGGDPLRETLTLIKTHNGKLFYVDENGEYWTMLLYIDDHLLFEKANTAELAFAGGKGLGKFQALLSDFDQELVDTLPGFHNIKFRFTQWEESLKKDLANRKNDLAAEISWIEERKQQMLEFYQLIDDGSIPKRVTHNDTKLSNFLFDKNKEVLCVIDLDTVLQSPILYDFGDAIRSYANTGKEDDRNLNNVSMDLQLFKAYTKGYLSEAKSFLSPVEIKYLAFGVRYIVFEQVLRFLMDYIDGDKYYKIHYPDHNLVRTRAQYKLLQSVEKHFKEMDDFIQRQ